MLILDSLRRSNTLGTSGDGLIVDALGIINEECNILNTVTVLLELMSEFMISRVQG